MRITTKGQVTIPQEIRERFGFAPHTDVEFIVEGSRVYVRRHQGDGGRRMRAWLDSVRGTADAGMSTDELMQLTRGED